MIAGSPPGAAPRVIGIDGSALPGRPGSRWPGSRAHGRVDRLEQLTDDEIVLDDRYHAGTYGIPDEQTLVAMRPAAGSKG